MRRAILAAGLGFAVLLLPSCGGDSPSTPTPVPTPTPAPVTTNIFSRPFSVVAAPAGSAVYGFQDVSVPNGGQVEVTFDYTFASSDIDMVVTPTTCLDAVAAYNSQCTVLSSDKAPASASKRARVVFQLSAASAIRVWIYSFAEVPESGVLNVLLTR